MIVIRRLRIVRPRLPRIVPRLLSLLVASMLGLTAVQGAVETPLGDEADRDERVAFRHFV